MEQQTVIATFRCHGFNFEMIIDDKRCNVGKCYYLTDPEQEKIYLASNHNGDPIPIDRLEEICWRGIVAIILFSMRNTKLRTEKFIYPVGAFLNQFYKTDTTERGLKEGTFQSGAITHRLKFDSVICYNGGFNGVYDYSSAEIIMDRQDREDRNTSKSNNYLSHIFIHEVFHGACSFAGFTADDGANEEFVQLFSLFLFDVISTIKFNVLT
jgi:hypothetical protein